MKRPLALMLATFGISAAVPTETHAYSIDCAILLCLAGGFPPSAPCASARAEMIRRITPWPIEPPLQLWRCPMRGAEQVSPDPWRSPTVPASLVVAPKPPVEWRTAVSPLGAIAESSPRPAAGEAVVAAGFDLSDSAFDVVRTIRVFDVARLSQRWSGGESSTCHQSLSIRMGSYGATGAFSWRTSGVGALPAAFEGAADWQPAASHVSSGSDCPGIYVRAVFIEWRDHEGNYDFEQVPY